ncbi:MAG: hypothetical protein ACK5RA_16100, partial [Cyanobacteriota bacterium]
MEAFVGERQIGVIAFIFKPNLALAQDGCPPAWLRMSSLSQPISRPATVATSSWPRSDDVLAPD